MKIKSKLLLAIAFTSLTALNLNLHADAKDGGGSDTSKDKTPKIQNVEVEHRDYDKKSSKVQKKLEIFNGCHELCLFIGRQGLGF